MNENMAVVAANGTAEAVEVVLEQAGDVVERRLFRKVLITIVVLVIGAAIVNLILNKGDISVGKPSSEEPPVPEDAADEPADAADEPADAADEPADDAGDADAT